MKYRQRIKLCMALVAVISEFTTLTTSETCSREDEWKEKEAETNPKFKNLFQNKGMDSYLKLYLAVKKMLWPGGPAGLYNHNIIR